MKKKFGERVKLFLRRTRKRRDKEFSKRIINRIVTCCLFFMFLSYVLAWFGKVEIAESLSVAIATTTIVTCIGYMGKSTIENLSKYTDTFGNNLYTPEQFNRMQDSLYNGYDENDGYFGDDDGV